MGKQHALGSFEWVTESEGKPSLSGAPRPSLGGSNFPDAITL